jgi:hypothetical protein
LGESAVDWGAERLDVLVEVDGRNGALGDAFGGEFEFLQEKNTGSVNISHLKRRSRICELRIVSGGAVLSGGWGGDLFSLE